MLLGLRISKFRHLSFNLLLHQLTDGDALTSTNLLASLCFFLFVSTSAFGL